VLVYYLNINTNKVSPTNIIASQCVHQVKTCKCGATQGGAQCFCASSIAPCCRSAGLSPKRPSGSSQPLHLRMHPISAALLPYPSPYQPSPPPAIAQWQKSAQRGACLQSCCLRACHAVLLYLGQAICLQSTGRLCCRQAPQSRPKSQALRCEVAHSGS
jgi:hypothetical protein